MVPSFSKNFDENIFIILGNLFSNLGYFFVIKVAKYTNLNNENKFGLFPSTKGAPNVGTLKLRLAILPYLKVT